MVSVTTSSTEKSTLKKRLKALRIVIKKFTNRAKWARAVTATRIVAMFFDLIGDSDTAKIAAKLPEINY